MGFSTLTEIAIYLAGEFRSNEYHQIQHQLNYELNHGTFADTRNDVDKLTAKLVAAGADRTKVIAIIDTYGDSVTWDYDSLDTIIGEVWQSDVNSGDEPGGWIINSICRQFNVPEVTE